MIKKIEISYRTIIFTVLLLLGVWFLYFIKDIILGFFVALLITAVLNPTVTRMTKYRIPRTMAVILVYLFMLGFTALVIAIVIPPLVEQTSGIINNLPIVLGNVGLLTNITDQIIKQLMTQLLSLPSQVAKVTISIFSNVLAVITILIFSFYLLVARKKFEDQMGVFFGEKNKERIIRIIRSLEAELGAWARGQLILMFAVGLLIYIGLKILGVPYALPLSILAGLLEIVPNIGPVISAIPPIIIGYAVSPVIGLSTVALAFLVHQSENYFLVPRIMQESTGVNPIITLLALAIGFRVAGIVGVLISIPVVIAIRVLTKEYFASTQKAS